MVAQCGVEGNARLQQRRVGTLELVDEVLRPLTAIHVVAQHQDQLERESCAGSGHLPADIELRGLPRAAVADHGELQRVRRAREGSLLPGECPWPRTRSDDDDEKELAHNQSSS